MSEELKLQQRVTGELAFDPAVNAAHIGVAVHGGVVTLSGHVETYSQKFAAEHAVRWVKGVTAVAQELVVRLPEDKKTADDEIAQRAVALLEWDIMIPPRAVTVTVEGGVVTLEGAVHSGFQRVEAEADVRKLGGVRGVINLLDVRPRVSPDDVHAKLLKAFERSAELEANRIIVETDGGKVVLRGTVERWAGRQEAERAAWSVPGVVAVEDHIAIAQR